MSTQVQIRRGTTAQHSSFTGAVAELTYDSDLKTVRVHDGSTAGGTRLTKTADLTSANVTELTNLYYTVDRANTAIDNRVTKAFVDALGVDATTLDGIDSLPFAKDTDLTTANVAELTNLYYTDARVQSNVVSYLTGNAVKTISGNLNITGNLSIAGTITTFTSNVVEIQDPMIYLATNNPGDVNDIGIVAHFVNPGYQHTGFVRDASDGVWKLFANVASEPSNNTLDFTNATYSTIKVGDVQANAITIGTWLGSTIAVAKGGTGTTTSTGTGSVVLNTSPTFTGTVTAAEISATGNVTSPFFYSQSDINLKKDIEPIVDALDIVKQLGGYSFKWKHNEAESLGLIAQYVEQVLPMLIGTTPDGSKTVLYNGIIALLLEAIKSQQVQIDEIKARLL